MRQTSMMILYCITIWANLGKPVFKICVQKHSTHRFPALPVDVTALLDSADPKLKGQEVICSQLIRANKSGTPAFISGVPLLIYLQEAGSDNSISLFFFLFFLILIQQPLHGYCPHALTLSVCIWNGGRAVKRGQPVSQVVSHYPRVLFFSALT